jgi:hypothetical protein
VDIPLREGIQQLLTPFCDKFAMRLWVALNDELQRQGARIVEVVESLDEIRYKRTSLPAGVEETQPRFRCLHG